MQINQKGEIVTIAIVVTFVILSIATIAASTFTDNKKTSLTTSTRAADACYVGKFCDVPACNDTITGGNSASCSECGGGWCRGGLCASCGTGPVSGGGGSGAGGSTDDCPGGKNAQGLCKCRSSVNPNAPYCAGGTSTVDIMCTGCAPEKGCQSVDSCPNGAAPTSAPQSTSAPAATSIPYSGGTGGGVGIGTSGSGGSAPKSTPKPIATSIPADSPACRIHFTVIDGGTGKPISTNTVLTVSQSDHPQTPENLGTGSTGKVDSILKYNTKTILVQPANSKFMFLPYTLGINPPGTNGFCDVELALTPKSLVTPTLAPFHCPAPASLDTQCSHHCAPDQCITQELSDPSGNKFTCYSCKDVVTNPFNPGLPSKSPASISAAPLPTGTDPNAQVPVTVTVSIIKGATVQDLKPDILNLSLFIGSKTLATSVIPISEFHNPYSKQFNLNLRKSDFLNLVQMPIPVTSQFVVFYTPQGGTQIHRYYETSGTINWTTKTLVLTIDAGN